MSTQYPATSVSGRLLTETVARGKLRLGIFASSLGMVWFAVAWGMPLIMFMDYLGASGVVIGAVSTIRQFIFAMQIPGSLIVESLPSRKRFFLTALLTERVLWFLPAGVPFLFCDNLKIASWAVLGIVVLTSICGQMGSVAWQSWMADLVPARLSNRFWGLREGCCYVGFLASTLVSGRILDAFPGDRPGVSSATGFALVFGIVAVFGVADIATWFFMPEPRPARAKFKKSLLRRMGEPLRHHNFRNLTLTFGCWLFSLGLTASFVSVYLKNDFGVSYTDLSILIIASCVGMIVAAPFWGQVIDRIGARAFGAAMLALVQVPNAFYFFLVQGPLKSTEVLAYLPAGWVPESWLHPANGGWTLPSAVAILLPSFFLSGVFVSGFNICRTSLCSLLAPKEGRSVAIAMHWTVAGLIACLAPVLGGVIMDRYASIAPGWHIPGGEPFSFFHLLLVLQALTAIGGGFFMIRIRTGSDKLPLGAAIRRMFVGNPLQAARNIYAMNGPVDSARRAQAALDLGERRTGLAVSDLAARLDDASADVREAAARALGNIGDSEAVRALIERMNDPHCDLRPQIARALRPHRGEAVLLAMLQHLDCGDRETVCECARTLGTLGEALAVVPLRTLLAKTEDEKVAAYSARALAKLHDEQARKDIWRWMKRAVNPALAASLAVAAADLDGEPEEFYKILSRERDGGEGKQGEKLLEQIARRLEASARHPQGRDEVQRRLILLKQTGRLYSDGDYSGCLNALADWRGELCAEFLVDWLREHPEGKIARTDILLCLYRISVG